MNARDAVELIADAVPPSGGTWADFGAGRGVFTHALVERIGSAGTVYAIDRDAGALSELRRRAEKDHLHVIPVRADFTKEFELPGLNGPALDGLLFANALHYVRDAGPVLRTLARLLRDGGRVVVVEYEGRAANPWVPHPIPPSRLQELAAAAGLTSPVVTAIRPSAFGGRLYVAVSERHS